MADTKTPNAERLRELARWARAEDDKRRSGLPSEWDQSLYFNRSVEELAQLGITLPAGCGTACCIAGKQVALEGWVPQFYDDEIHTTATVFNAKGERRIADELAEETLGLTNREATLLFDAMNTIDDVERIVEEIIAGKFREEAQS